MKNVTEPCSRHYASQNNCLHTFFLCDYVLMLPFWPGAPCKSNNASQETSWLNMGWIKSEICIYFLLRMLETGASDGNHFQHSTSRRYDKACVSQCQIWNNTTPHFTRHLRASQDFRNTEANTRISILTGKCRSLYLFITFFGTVKFKQN